MRVLVLFVRHGTGKYRDAFAALDQIYQKQAPKLSRRTIIVDNAIPSGVAKAHGNDCILIGGDNTDWEFSAWQHALDVMGSEVKRFDAVHFVSAAFQMLYNDYLNRFSPRIVELVAKRPVCTGHIDYYPYPIKFGAYASRHWIRTSFWLINPSELARLGSLVSVRNKQAPFSRRGDWPFERSGPLSPGYQQLIFSWLTSNQGTGQGTAWHSRIDLDDQAGRKLFEGKAVAIMNEHLLSIRLRAQGTSVLDMTYLAELTERGEELPLHWPSWREQMRIRGIPGHDHISHSPVR